MLNVQCSRGCKLRVKVTVMIGKAPEPVSGAPVTLPIRTLSTFSEMELEVTSGFTKTNFRHRFHKFKKWASVFR